MARPVITLLTDFGLADHYVASMKGVMLTIAPDVVFVDISHSIAPFDIEGAAYELAQAWKCFPLGTVHLVVVDPGVGSERRAIAAAAGGHYFVGPDNGVFTMALESAGEVSVREINEVKFFRHPVSRTFHGRDIFSPVAAELVNGIGFDQFGPCVADSVRLGGLRPDRLGPNTWQGRILRIDRFGNAITNFDWSSFSWVAGNGFEFSIGATVLRTMRLCYSAATPGEVFVLRGSSDYLEIASNQSDASAPMGLTAGVPLLLTRL